MTLQEDSESVAVKMLAERLGEDAFKRRLMTEQQLLKMQGDRRSYSKYGPLFDPYKLMKRLLQISGFWGRAVRNYLNVQVVENTVYLERLPPEFDGFRVLHLTDLHADLHPDFVDSLKKTIGPLNYDLIVITGDFRSATFGDYTGATTQVIRLAEAFNAPAYCVLGNHDSISKVPRLEAVGMQFLLNENAFIERDGVRLYLVGIDDPNYYKTHDFERAMSGVPADVCKLLLSHSPETYVVAAEQGIDFQMSGHTHGGQICLPGGYVIVHDGSAPRHLLKGAWREGSLQGYTGNGTGGCALPARLNCPAEATVHILRCCT
jgi:Predicted phosphohydrolases